MCMPIIAPSSRHGFRNIALDPRRRVAEVEGQSLFAQVGVRGGEAFHPPQVLDPGLVDEVFDVAARVGGVAEQARGRLVLTLREVEGLSYEEIMEVMDCSLDSVKARLKRSRQGFENMLRHFEASSGV